MYTLVAKMILSSRIVALWLTLPWLRRMMALVCVPQFLKRIPKTPGAGTFPTACRIRILRVVMAIGQVIILLRHVTDNMFGASKK